MLKYGLVYLLCLMVYNSLHRIRGRGSISRQNESNVQFVRHVVLLVKPVSKCGGFNIRTAAVNTPYQHVFTFQLFLPSAGIYLQKFYVFKIMDGTRVLVS